LYIFQSVALFVCAFLILFVIDKLQSMSDDIEAQQIDTKIDQIIYAKKELLNNQMVIADLIVMGVWTYNS